jgi:hypothetical protein
METPEIVMLPWVDTVVETGEVLSTSLIIFKEWVSMLFGSRPLVPISKVLSDGESHTT